MIIILSSLKQTVGFHLNFLFSDNHRLPKVASLSALSWVGGKSCYNLGQNMWRILHFLTRRTSILHIWYLNDPFPHPSLVNVVQSGAEMIQPDFNIVLGMKGRVFVIASAFKSFFLKLDMTTSVFWSFLSKFVGV